MTRFFASTLLLALLASAAAAQDDAQLRELRARFDKGSSALRAGDDGAARTAFEAVGTALAPAFAAGRIQPRSSDEAWVLYAGAVLVQSDLWRYRLEDPARARDIERDLGEQAEKLGYIDLAAAQWLAVADIERFDLHRDDAALAAYRKVLAMKGVDGGLRDQALQGLARTPGGDPGALAKAVADLPLDMAHVEATSLVIPHLSVYRTGGQAAAYGEFAAAHPRSYRAVYAAYAGFLVTIVFRHEKAENPATPASAFRTRHPDDVLGLDVLHQLDAFQKREGKSAEAETTRRQYDELKTRLGLTGRATPVPSAKTRPLLYGAERIVAARDCSQAG